MANSLHLRLKAALAGEPLPCAVVELDCFDRNFDRLIAAGRGKRLRVATKSVRSLALLRLLVERGAGFITGLMTYSAKETEWLAEEGLKDLLLAYPTVQPSDCAAIARANKIATAAVVVDSEVQLRPLLAAAVEAGVTIPVVIDVDMSYRPVEAVHLGVRRSPLRTPYDVVALAKVIHGAKSLRFLGLQAYEAQIAGVGDGHPANRVMKAMSRGQVEKRRAELAEALAAAGYPCTLFNGGGTGSVSWAAGESVLTEITVGSGALASHLFDHYQALKLEPAAFFALQVVRTPADGFVTCHGGGLVASGAAGKDRLPIPVFPEGLELLPLEGAGEVQTPLRGPGTQLLALGDPVFFRHAKAGELGEHFNEYLLVRGERIVARAPTYRGLGHAFLG